MSDNAPDPMAMSQAWEVWLDRVSPEEREVVAQVLESHDTSEFVGMAKFLQALCVQCFRGRVSPVALEATRHLTNQMLAVLFMSHQKEGAAGLYQHSAAGALIEMTRHIEKVKMIAPTYTTGPQVLDADEMIDAKVKRAVGDS